MVMDYGFTNVQNKLFYIVAIGSLVWGLVSCTTEKRVTVESTTTTLDGYSEIEDANTGMTLRWKFATTNVTFEVVGQTTGWVAVGFEPTHAMKNANIIIGFVSNGAVTISDDFGTSNENHSPDTSISGIDNLSNVTGNETSGVTTIHFTIPIDSGDVKDKALVSGQTYTVMLAKGSEDNLTSAHSASHSGRTTFSLKL